MRAFVIFVKIKSHKQTFLWGFGKKGGSRKRRTSLEAPQRWFAPAVGSVAEGGVRKQAAGVVMRKGGRRLEGKDDHVAAAQLDTPASRPLLSP